METETLKMMLIVAGSFISLLLSIIGYFLNKHIKVIESLVTAVNALNVTVKLLEIQQNNKSDNCLKTHLLVDTEIKSLQTTVSKNSIAINGLGIKITDHLKTHHQ